MALNLNDINATVREKLFPVAVDNVFENILLFYSLVKRNKVRMDGPGKDGYVTQPIIAGKYPIYSHDNQYGRLNVPTNDILATAKFKFATFYGSLPLTREDENILTTDAAVLNTLRVRFETMTTSLIEELERRLFVQEPVSEGSSIDSLSKIIDNGDVYPEYAGLSRIDFPNWKAFVLNKNNTSITYTDLSNVIGKLKKGRETATLVLTTPELWTATNKIIFDKQHYLTMDKDIFNLGEENFKIFSAPCVSSPYVPTGTMFFINENFLYLILKNNTDEKGMTLEDYVRADLATVKAMHLFWDGQLYSPSPWLHAKIINAAP